MGEAKRRREAGAERLPRRFWCILFKDGHRLAGQIVRVGRCAAIHFREDEALLVQAQLEDDLKLVPDTTVVEPILVKQISKMLKAEAAA